MAKVYRVKDGSQGDRTDEGKEVSSSSLISKLENYTCQFLCEEPPQFNSDNSSDYYRHVVIEVTDESELSRKFPNKGFYVVANLDPTNSGFIYEDIET